MCLSVLLSVCLSLGAAQTKQTAVFMKQGRATRVFCLVVHFSTHTHTHTHMLTCTHVHTPKYPALLIFYLPCSVEFLPPCVFCPAQSLSRSRSAPSAQCKACSLSDREECHSVWPLTYNKEGCRFRQESEGAAAVMCPGLEGNTHTHTHTHTNTQSQVVS